MTPRGWAVLTVAALAVAAVATAWARVPWHTLAAPRGDQFAALRELPAAAVDRGRLFHHALRPAAYGSMAVALIVALVLATSLGGLAEARGTSWAPGHDRPLSGPSTTR